MDDVLKHRLVGTAMLLIISAVFLPMIFSDIQPQQTVAVQKKRQALPKSKKTVETFQPQRLAQIDLDKPRPVAQKTQAKSAAPKVTAKKTQTPLAKKTSPKPKPVLQKVPVKKQVAKKSPIKKIPTQKAQPVTGPNAWVVQLGSFTNLGHANALEKRLRRQGYSAFSRKSTNSRGVRYTRVLVGPEVKKAKAVRLAVKLQSDLKLKGIVLHYSPIKKRA